MPDEIFNFVIARPWSKEEPDNLCTYAYGAEIHRGDRAAANRLCAYANRSLIDPAKKYSVYKVTYEQITN